MLLPDLFNSQKEIAVFPEWSNAESETKALIFSAPLTVAGVVEEAFTLDGVCFQNVPDKHVSFELRVAGPRKRKIPIARFEWRSLRKGHTNKRRVGSPVSGNRVGATHYHSFEHNWVEANRAMRTGLHQAEDFEPEPQSFESLRTEIGKLFRINNMEIVSIPPWEYTLF